MTTPGPWHVVNDDGVISIWSRSGEVAAYITNADDAELIVAAVNARREEEAAAKERGKR